MYLTTFLEWHLKIIAIFWMFLNLHLELAVFHYFHCLVKQKNAKIFIAIILVLSITKLMHSFLLSVLSILLSSKNNAGPKVVILRYALQHTGRGDFSQYCFDHSMRVPHIIHVMFPWFFPGNLHHSHDMWTHIQQKIDC